MKETHIILIYGQEISPTVPALAKFALEFTRGTDFPGYFHLFFKSETGLSQIILSGDVHDRNGSQEFSPYKRESFQGSVIPHDERLLRLLDVFSREANARRQLAGEEIEQALDEICHVRSSGAV